MDQENIFVHDGYIFTVTKEADGKYVSDIRVRSAQRGEDELWARVVGRFDSEGDAITRAKQEIAALGE